MEQILKKIKLNGCFENIQGSALVPNKKKKTRKEGRCQSPVKIFSMC
jgi:hypothetical protein